MRLERKGSCDYLKIGEFLDFSLYKVNYFGFKFTEKQQKNVVARRRSTSSALKIESPFWRIKTKPSLTSWRRWRSFTVKSLTKIFWSTPRNKKPYTQTKEASYLTWTHSWLFGKCAIAFETLLSIYKQALQQQMTSRHKLKWHLQGHLMLKRDATGIGETDKQKCSPFDKLLYPLLNI